MNGKDMVITGLGVVAATGMDAEEHWESVLAGKSGIGRISHFDPSSYPVALAGEVGEFSARERVPRQLVPQTDRWTHLALYGAESALADAGVDLAAFDEYEMAVVTSSSSGGTEFGQHEMEQLYTQGPGWVGVYQSIAWFYAATTGQISIRHGMRGPCGVISAEQAGGLDALGQARRLLRGQSRLVVTGGTDASLCPYGLVAQLSSGMLSRSEQVDRAYLPFDSDAAGYVPGEGGAILIAERGEPARAEGRGYGVVLGYAAGFDLPGRPTSLARTVRRALADARLDPDDVDVVYADAMGDPRHDQEEAEVIAEVFGPRGVPVTAPKVLSGRLYGGGAPLDVATALLGLRDGVVPHTPGVTRPLPGIDLVREAPRESAPRVALVIARGYGGFNAAVALGRIDR
ncbi:ketosynthase chain-length factor [Streptomyces huasconensis]|uniref:ketosynthase chain-length factor n=1 Tax=Streptomyces huasconensis TaxID=1854574 RepID=UPI0033FDB9CB